jgi:predicted Fe-Mo cluster-binding NifX family protein
MRIAVPCVESRGKYILVPHFGRAPSFAIVDVEGDKYNLVEVFRNEYITREHGRGVALVNELIARGVNALLTLEIGYGAYYKVRESGIKIYYITPEDKRAITLEEAIQMFISGKSRRRLGRGKFTEIKAAHRISNEC